MKHLKAFALNILAVVALTLPTAAQQKVTLKFAIGAPDGPGGEIQGMKALKEYAEFKSKGTLEIRTFFNTLGGSLQVTEQVKNGTLEMALTDDSVLGSFHKQMQVFQIPYLFPSSPVAWEFMKSPFVRELTEDMRKATGIRTLTLSENGFRNLTNSVREIKGPDDMKGLKMRTMQSQVYVNFMKSLGASATPISFPELIPALRQSVVDGQENSSATVWDGKLYEVQKFMSVNEHIYGLHLIIINDKIYEGLSAEHKQILQDAARMHAEVANSRKALDSLQAIDKIKAQGVQIYVTSSSEKDQFKKASQGAVIDFIATQAGKEVVDKLLAAVDVATKQVYGQ